MRNTLRVNAVGALLLVVAAMFWVLPPDSPVADAAARGDLEAVRSLVKGGADVNAAQGDGMTALHWAAVNGDAEMAEILIHVPASVSAVTSLGRYTPLHLASVGGHARVVKALLAEGADPNALTSTGAVTALQFAAGSGIVEAVAALLDAGAEVNRAERQWGHTALMFAVEGNRADAVRMLLQRGADPEITGTVIDVVKREREDVEQHMRRDDILGLSPISQGRARPLPEPDPAIPADDPTRRPFGTTDQIGGYGGMSALTLAAREGNVEASMALLDEGANINQVEAGQGSSPLLVATTNGHFDLALMLLERGADPNLVAHSGNNPLFATINIEWAPKAMPPLPAYVSGQKTTYLEMMEALIEAGADVNARLRYDIWFIEMGVSTLGVDWMGATPFFRAAHAQDIATMRFLVRNGADPSIPTIKPAPRPRRASDSGGSQQDPSPSGLPPVPAGGPGLYPIHVAAGHSGGSGRQSQSHRGVEDGWLPTVRYLVEEHGADVNARDFNGDTPLHNAAYRGHNELILYLVEKGADVMAVNRDGLTTVDKANSPVQRAEPHPETIKLLESLGAKNNHNCVAC